MTCIELESSAMTLIDTIQYPERFTPYILFLTDYKYGDNC